MSDLDSAAPGTPPDDDPTAQRPVIKLSATDRRSIALNGIFLMLAVYMLHYASAILIPITFAFLLFLLLTRPVQALGSLGIPPAVTAILGVGLVGAVLVGSAMVLSGPAQKWIETLPGSFYKVEQKLKTFRKPFEETEKAIRQVEEATNVGTKPGVQKVEIETPSYIENFFSGTPQLLTAIGSSLLLLLFLLSSGDAFVRKLVAMSPTLTDKKRALEITRNIQGDISFYLLTITLLNIATGVATGLFCLIIGVREPFLWGSLATLFGYVPFVGPMLMTGTLTFVGMLEFDELLTSLSVPLVYILSVVVTNSGVLPLVLGRRLTLNPVAIFLSIMFWGWAWGVVGILLAVPVLACVKIFCERIEPLQPVAEFLTP